MTSTFTQLTAPIKRLIISADPSTATTTTDPSSRRPSLPTSWVCHECVEILGIASSTQNQIADGNCQGCDHERCGLCDVVYVQPKDTSKPLAVNAGVFDDGDQMKRLKYHWDPSQDAVKEVVVAA